MVAAYAALNIAVAAVLIGAAADEVGIVAKVVLAACALLALWFAIEAAINITKDGRKESHRADADFEKFLADMEAIREKYKRERP